MPELRHSQEKFRTVNSELVSAAALGAALRCSQTLVAAASWSCGVASRDGEIRGNVHGNCKWDNRRYLNCGTRMTF